MGGGSLSFRSAWALWFRDRSLPGFYTGRCRDEPAAGAASPLPLPGFPGVSMVVACMDQCLPPSLSAPSLPPPVCTWSAASRCRFRLFASSGLGEASSLPLPAGITGSPRVYLGLAETLIGMKGICCHRRGKRCSFGGKNKSMRLNGFSYPSVGLHLFKFYPVCPQWHQFHC